MNCHSLKIQGMRQIYHLPATAISGLKISRFNFTFLAAIGWFAMEKTNWRHTGYRPQGKDKLTYLAACYSSQDLQALGWRLELIWSLADVHISFQHPVIKRTTSFRRIRRHHSWVNWVYFSKVLGSSSQPGFEISMRYHRYLPDTTHQGLLLTVTHWGTDSWELPVYRVYQNTQKKIQTAASG